MSQAAEEKASSKVLQFLAPVEFSKWGVKVRRCLKKIKVDPLSDFDTEYVDIDQILCMYMDEFKQTKRYIQRKLQKNFTRYVGEVGLDAQISTEIVHSVAKDIRPSKTQNSLLNFAGPISNIRSLLYALMCGGNNNEINELELIAACNRFGVDNPV
jgi:hypothetical protein